MIRYLMILAGIMLLTLVLGLTYAFNGHFRGQSTALSSLRHPPGATEAVDQATPGAMLAASGLSAEQTDTVLREARSILQSSTVEAHPGESEASAISATSNGVDTQGGPNRLTGWESDDRGGVLTPFLWTAPPRLKHVHNGSIIEISSARYHIAAIEVAGVVSAPQAPTRWVLNADPTQTMILRQIVKDAAKNTVVKVLK